MTEDVKDWPVNWPFPAAFERLAISADEHEMMLRDIKKKAFEELGSQGGIVNLSPAEFSSAPFPVEGVIYGENKRMMICLTCRRDTHYFPAAATIRVWFIVNTASNGSFLAKDTIKALIREDEPLPSCIGCAIQDPKRVIERYMSKGNFEEANVLGMDALARLGLLIDDFDWKTSSFKLVKK